MTISNLQSRLPLLSYSYIIVQPAPRVISCQKQNIPPWYWRINTKVKEGEYLIHEKAGSHNIMYTTFSNLTNSQPYFLWFRQAGREELLSGFILSAKIIPIEVQEDLSYVWKAFQFHAAKFIWLRD